MRRCSPLAMLACLTLSGCGGPLDRTGEIVKADKPPIVEADDASVRSAGDYEIGEPVRIDNLTVFPVLSKAPRDEDRFITLDEGLRAGTVQVFEVGVQTQDRLLNLADSERAAADRTVPDDSFSADEDVASAATAVESANPPADDELTEWEELGGGEVNRLMVVNRSDKPLYLMPGEVIVGGSQDRTIAESIILAANTGPTEIEVYCVEHGRWGRREDAESIRVIYGLSSDPEQVESLSEDASEGKFVVGAGLLNKGSRVAAADRKGQAEVWDEVAKANGKLNVNSSSDAFTYNLVDEDVQEKLVPYQSALKSFGDVERVVGVVVAINGKPETVDVFESTPLFRKFWPKLMQGYCLDAIQAAEEVGADTSCSPEVAVDFLASVLSGEGQQSESSRDGLVLSRRETDQSVGFSAGGGMGGGMGGAVHSSGFSK